MKKSDLLIFAISVPRGGCQSIAIRYIYIDIYPRLICMLCVVNSPLYPFLCFTNCSSLSPAFRNTNSRKRKRKKKIEKKGMAKRELYGLEETVCAHMSGARKRTSTYRCCMAKSIVYVSGSLRTSMYEHKKRRKRTDVGDARVRRPDPFSLAPAGLPHPHKHTCLFGQEGKLARAFYNCDFAPPSALLRSLYN